MPPDHNNTLLRPIIRGVTNNALKELLDRTKLLVKAGLLKCPMHPEGKFCSDGSVKDYHRTLCISNDVSHSLSTYTLVRCGPSELFFSENDVAAEAPIVGQYHQAMEASANCQFEVGNLKRSHDALTDHINRTPKRLRNTVEFAAVQQMQTLSAARLAVATQDLLDNSYADTEGIVHDLGTLDPTSSSDGSGATTPSPHGERPFKVPSLPSMRTTPRPNANQIESLISTPMSSITSLLVHGQPNNNLHTDAHRDDLLALYEAAVSENDNIRADMVKERATFLRQIQAMTERLDALEKAGKAPQAAQTNNDVIPTAPNAQEIWTPTGGSFSGALQASRPKPTSIIYRNRFEAVGESQVTNTTTEGSVVDCWDIRPTSGVWRPQGYNGPEIAKSVVIRAHRAEIRKLKSRLRELGMKDFIRLEWIGHRVLEVFVCPAAFEDCLRILRENRVPVIYDFDPLDTRFAADIFSAHNPAETSAQDTKKALQEVFRSNTEKLASGLTEIAQSRDRAAVRREVERREQRLRDLSGDSIMRVYDSTTRSWLVTTRLEHNANRRVDGRVKPSSTKSFAFDLSTVLKKAVAEADKRKKELAEHQAARMEAEPVDTQHTGPGTTQGSTTQQSPPSASPPLPFATSPSFISC